MKKGNIITLAIVGFILLWVLFTYSKIVGFDEKVDSSWAQVENVLQRRFDLIPNLVNTVKGFATQEEEVVAGALDRALGRLMVVVENYPDLKSNQNFLALQAELAGTENRIAVERRRYNEAVQDYNATIRRFPGNMIASISGMERREAYFKADSGAEKVPEVTF